MFAGPTDAADPFAVLSDLRRSAPVVRSANFEFLRQKRTCLADLGGFAEQYLHPDPASALIKLRTFAEAMTNDLYAALGLHQPFDTDFFTLLDGQPFKDAVPQVVLTKFYAVRKLGNQAAHGGGVNLDMARRALGEAHPALRWQRELGAVGLGAFIDGKLQPASEPGRRC